MKIIDVIMVRIYITESSRLLNSIVDYLRNVTKMRGISVFRAISGYGETGDHEATLIDLSLDLPLTIEFFDSKEKVDSALDYLSKFIKQEHMVFWPAKANG